MHGNSFFIWERELIGLGEGMGVNCWVYRVFYDCCMHSSFFLLALLNTFVLRRGLLLGNY